MEENFFIENPELMENNFYNKDLKSSEFDRNFSEKSRQMVKVMSMKNRHAKKVKKQNKKNQQTPWKPSNPSDASGESRSGWGLPANNNNNTV